jgi:hypothetical protein
MLACEVLRADDVGNTRWGRTGITTRNSVGAIEFSWRADPRVGHGGRSAPAPQLKLSLGGMER